MSKKIPLGDGTYLEPDKEPRNTRFHVHIVGSVPIPNTRTGHRVALECGHQVITFGNLAHCGGVILCQQCKDQQEAQ